MEHPPMRLGGVTAAVVAVAALAGCTTAPSPVPAVTRTQVVTVTPSPAASEPFRVPPVTSREVVRSTYSHGSITAGSETLPDTDVFTVTAACTSGSSGVLRYVMQDEQGEATGLAGAVKCDGSPTTQTLGLGSGQRPSTVMVQLSTSGPVDAGYAVLRRGSASDLVPTPTASPASTLGGAASDTPLPTPTSSGSK